MEHLNKVQLRGVVGTVNLQELSGKRVCRFTLATDRAYKDAMGEAKIDTTWHTVNAWEGSKNIPDLDLIKKGSRVGVWADKEQQGGECRRNHSNLQRHPGRQSQII